MCHFFFRIIYKLYIYTRKQTIAVKYTGSFWSRLTIAKLNFNSRFHDKSFHYVFQAHQNVVLWPPYNATGFIRVHRTKNRSPKLRNNMRNSKNKHVLI